MSDGGKVSGIDPNDEAAVLAGIKALVGAGRYRLSFHANRRLSEYGLSMPEVLEALAGGQLLENYPTYHHGPCCLVYGDTAAGRPLHVVCSSTLPELVVITVYRPTPPQWRTPTARG